MQSSDDYDLFVIGAGSGGVRAARLAAGLGARVAVAEERYLGGTCVNVGCVPKKLFVYASMFAHEFSAARGFGWDLGEFRLDWRRLVENKNREIARLQGVYERLLKSSGAEIHTGRATLVDPHTVQVADRSYRARHILIATGGWPHIPAFPGSDLAVTSNEMFFLEELPKRILIVGGGYIAVEFACILQGLGVDVTLSYRGGLFLRGFDDDVRRFLADEMQKQGIALMFESNVRRIARSDSAFAVEFSDGATLNTDLVMYATGRVPNTRGLGLEQVGVDLAEDGAIRVDEHYQTNIASIHALGDVTNRVNLTPVAIAEARAFVGRHFGSEPLSVDYEYIPTAVFSQPNIGTVGLTESQARERFEHIAVFKTQFTPMKNVLGGSDQKTLMKMLVDRASDRVVGVHMVGPDAGEIIQGMAVALRAGATKAVFDSTIGIHPTAAEEFVTLREPVT